ncbi:hypothetical protein [Endobacterium cereale]|uniref:hypothetical protein n=1 Tax=Endobacterium cereale TaxID=2663029 RepID=UPI002B4A3B06|nr:hypothetical protein [Endobacterium cereale]MEB2843876.1 hypothetical protein [Endobacterium cereale]
MTRRSLNRERKVQHDTETVSKTPRRQQGIRDKSRRDHGHRFATITFAGFCLFFAGDPVPPEGADIWSILCWIGILVGAIAAYCTCQALFDLFVAATIGNEWMIGIIMLLFLVCLIFAFVDGLALLID